VSPVRFDFLDDENIEFPEENDQERNNEKSKEKRSLEENRQYSPQYPEDLFEVESVQSLASEYEARKRKSEKEANFL
jgi:formylmethanofuran dehydrogenase subunit E